MASASGERILKTGGEGGGVMTMIDASHPILTVAFCSNTYWPTPAGPKHLSLPQLITSNIHVNSVARKLETEE